MKKNHRMRQILCILTTIAVAWSFAACGASSGGSKTESMMQNSASYANDAAYEETPVTEEAMSADTTSNKLDSGTGENGALSSISQTQMPEDLNLKLIWTANVSMETLEFDQSIQDINALVSELGGFVESSSTSGGSDSRGNYINKYAYFTLRIPSEKLDGFIGQLNDCGTITSQDLSSENISLEYADTEARKEALETEYDRLLELMAQAESIDAVVTIESRLSEVRLQLDSLSSQLRTYDNLVDYSTVYLNIQEVRNITGTNAVTIGERISNGFSETLYNLQVFFEDLIVFVVVNIPIFLIIAVVVIIALLVLRALRRSARKKEAAKSLPDTNPSEQKPEDKQND